MIEKRGNNWCVVHGHPRKVGSKTDRPKGSTIKCFEFEASNRLSEMRAKKKAEKMHQAIVISQHSDSLIFKDSLSEVKNIEITPEGYLHVPARVGRPGILKYYRGDGMLDHIAEFQNLEIGTEIPVLRDDNDAFDVNSLATYKYKPVTNDHPYTGLVDAKNVKDFQIGFTKDTVRNSNGLIKLDLVITDNEAIRDIQKGKFQISAGYKCELIIGDGDHPKYGFYKAKQTAIKCNHIAIVDKGRAGDEIRIGDKQSVIKRSKKMNETEILNLHKRKFGGVTVSFSDQAVEAFDQISEKLKALKIENSKLKVELNDAIAKSEKLTGQLDAEKAKMLDTAAIDQLVKERVEIVDSAKRLNPEIEIDGKSNIEIMKNAIKNVSLDGKSDEYVKGVFETQVANFQDSAQKDAVTLDNAPIDMLTKAREKFINETSGRR